MLKTLTENRLSSRSSEKGALKPGASMLLHELPWQPLLQGSNWSYCFVTETATFWRFRKPGVEIYEIRSIAAPTDSVWLDLTSIAAQAILYDLTREGNDAAE